MRWPSAIALTFALTLASSGCFMLTGLNPMGLVVLVTAGWAAFDSRTIELKRYKSGLSYGPVVLFLAIALLWFLGFPWYLAVRHRIKSGLAELKADALESAGFDEDAAVKPED